MYVIFPTQRRKDAKISRDVNYLFLDKEAYCHNNINK